MESESFYCPAQLIDKAASSAKGEQPELTHTRMQVAPKATQKTGKLTPKDPLLTNKVPHRGRRDTDKSLHREPFI